MNTLVGAGPLRLVAASPSRPGGQTENTANVGVDPRRILAEHLPNPDETACSSCGYTYTKAKPLCPPVADALRVMNSRAHARSFGNYSTKQLRAMEREHCGAGRCRRCGFVYSPNARLCPTSRRIAIELESRFKAPMSEVRAGQGLCFGKGRAWSVTENESAPWRQAIAACAQCPLLAQCEARLENQLASGAVISDQIVAGRVFSTQGAEIKPEKLEDYANQCGMNTKGRNQRPRPRRTTVRATSAPAPAATPREQLPLFEGAAA